MDKPSYLAEIVLDDNVPLSISSAWDQCERRCIVRAMTAYGHPVKWQPIVSAPHDGTDFLAAILMEDDDRTWWEQHVIWIDTDTGKLDELCQRDGVELSDYDWWQPLPANPAANE